MEPPVAFANCAPAHRSSGHVVVTAVGMASRLNQYGNWTLPGGMVPVALMISGLPTTAPPCGTRSSVKPAANAGEAETVSAVAATAVRTSVRAIMGHTVHQGACKSLKTALKAAPALRALHAQPPRPG